MQRRFATGGEPERWSSRTNASDRSGGTGTSDPPGGSFPRDGRAWDPAVTSGLRSYPPADQWDDWVELDQGMAGAGRAALRDRSDDLLQLRAACGLLAYVDKETLRIRKLEGNPLHRLPRPAPRARRRSTDHDPDRILYPMKRAARRGPVSGSGRPGRKSSTTSPVAIRTALLEERHNEIMYHVGWRPGEDGYMEKVLQSWDIGDNSHTNVCSAGARRLCQLDGHRPALAGPRQREVHPS
ncbi:MAG: hypothetical protein R2849_06785 [Thermomicrobiales bacterium]